jgi:hypothetical protein
VISHFEAEKSFEGVEELKNGSFRPYVSNVGEEGREAEGEGVEGRREVRGDGGRDWIAWITNWLLVLLLARVTI